MTVQGSSVKESTLHDVDLPFVALGSHLLHAIKKISVRNGRRVHKKLVTHVFRHE